LLKKNMMKTIQRIIVASMVIMIVSSWAPFASAKPSEVQTSVFMDANRNKIFDELEQIMGHSSDSAIDVIVMFKTAPSDYLIESIRHSVGWFTVKLQWTIIPGMAASLTPSQIWASSWMDEVVQIEYDAPVYACLDTATYWYGAQKARTDFNVDGDGDGNATAYSKDDIVIAIIDTGIDPGHVDLDEGKIIGWKDFVNNRAEPYDDHGHGTHCASIAAGTGEGNSAYKGVAPAAALVGVKVLNSQGSGTASNVVSGINWAVDNNATYGIEILSCSFGTSGSSDGTDSVSQACNNAVDKGLVVSVAAGNSGPAKYTIGSPGAAEKVITVGSIADVSHKGFFLNSWSSRGPTKDDRIKPDVCGPGYLIMAAKYNTKNEYVEKSGTSMSTPFVAGTVALMLDANPSLNPTEVKNTIASTSIDWGPSGKDIDYGWGRLDSYEAIRSAGSLSGTGPAVPNHFYGQEDLPRSRYYDLWKITVTSTDYPLAVSFIIPDWKETWLGGTPDFDIYIYDPAGKEIGKSTGTKRQEIIAVSISATGTYTLKVYSYRGSGKYFFDISVGGSGISLSKDDGKASKRNMHA